MIIFSAGNDRLKKYIFFNYGAELQINKATMVHSLDQCPSDIRVFSRNLHMRQVCITGSILN